MRVKGGEASAAISSRPPDQPRPAGLSVSIRAIRGPWLSAGCRI